MRWAIDKSVCMTPTSLKLSPITTGSIGKGGYIIGYDGSIPSGARVLLGVPDLAHSMDVTGRKPGDLLGSDNLPQFLALIGKQQLWGTKASCRIFVKQGPSIVASSNEQSFPCPVRPYTGRLHPADLGRGDAGPPLQYTGVQDGRMLHMPAIDGCHYFAYGGRFETENGKRGFNCITYVGAVFGVEPASKAMSGYGTQLAVHCGCVPCNVENRTLAEVRTYFAGAGARGTYIMWSASHVVLVVNAAVHEFRQSLGRYNTQPIAQWKHADDRWWVRKAPKTF